MDKIIGKHYIIDFQDCDHEVLTHKKDIEKIMLSVAKKSHMTVMNYTFQQFEPIGVSGYLIIAESHFSIHTWPEENFAAIDVFSCGKIEIDTVLKELKHHLKTDKVNYQLIHRGI